MQTDNSVTVADLGRVFTTASVQPWHRRAWLREVIGREYADVELSAPALSKAEHAMLFNEMHIYPWQSMQLSMVRSNGISIVRPKREIGHSHLDNYLLVVLLSGRYQLQQQGQEVFLKPGDMALYDATRPHQITCPQPFSKILVSIPRPLLHQQLPAAGLCCAQLIHGQQGMGTVLSGMIRQWVGQLRHVSPQHFNAGASSMLDLLSLNLNALQPQQLQLTRSRSLSLLKVKNWLAEHVHEAGLDSAQIAAETGMSSRYLNQLFADEGTSLMRYVWQMRLQMAAQWLRNPVHHHWHVSDIAMACGFNDFSHFSRAFKQVYGLSPRAYRHSPLC